MLIAQMACMCAVATQGGGDFMSPADYRVGSWVVEKDVARYGQIFTNYARPTTELPRGCAPAGAMTLVVRGGHIYVVNDGKAHQSFYAQKGRLYLVLEAQNQGKWQPIQYLKRSREKTDYHMVSLEPKQFWHLSLPSEDRGSPKLNCRYRLMDAHSNTFSNVFQMRVSPNRFKLAPDLQRGWSVNENGVLYEVLDTDDLLNSIRKQA